MEIIGIWSTLYLFPHDPQEEVLVLLPNGQGYFEFYWWRLDYYESFDYAISGSRLHITGKNMYSLDEDAQTSKVEKSTFRYAAAFEIEALDSQEEIKYSRILRLSKPLKSNLPNTDKFGLREVGQSLDEYEPPSFDRR